VSYPHIASDGHVFFLLDTAAVTEITHMTVPLYLAASSPAKSVVCILLYISRISISVTSTRIMSATHPMNLLPPHHSWEVEGWTAVFTDRTLCRLGRCFCFECHCDSFGLFLSLFLHWCVCVCVLQSHCPVDDCATPLYRTQR